MKRALTIKDIENFKPTELNFTGDWLDGIGRPEQTGVWLIWGNSGQGKTFFAMQMAKYLSNFVKVCYNSLEEGLSKSVKDAVIKVNFNKERNFILLDKEPIKELIERLKRRKSPKAVIIDSIQYSGLTYFQVIKLKEMFPKKIFIYVSHAEGAEPKGNIAKSVRFDANVKIYVSEFQAQITSRYGGGKPYIIWADRVNKLS
ncbi:MAG: DNA repair protein RadA [Prevotellaceae bacterium]|jgi:tRNA uridine 5-carbamoylmethylation protein Kti12|nr:DNA repair protein RadA [Prevotellaceae bacterium]